MSRVVDTLPKHWGGRGSAAIPEQLTAKANSHSVLLDTLQHAGVLEQMPPSALRCFDNCRSRLLGFCYTCRPVHAGSPAPCSFKTRRCPGRTDACC